MSSSFQPTYATPQHQHQQPSRRSYDATEVRECLCFLFIALLLAVTTITFILSLSLRPHRPRFYISSFSALGLTQSTGPANSTLTFNITDRNPNAKIGIYYDAIYAAVFYGDKQIGSGPVLSPLYQPPKNSTVILGTLTAVGPTRMDPIWDRFSSDVRAGKVSLELRLTTVIRFQRNYWDTYRHRLFADCNFQVGKDGNIMSKYVNHSCALYF